MTACGHECVHTRSSRLIIVLTVEHFQDKEGSAIGRLFKKV